MKLHFIINERAGNGKGKRVWKKLQNELKSPFSYHITEYKGHGIKIAQQIVNEDSASGETFLIIAIGGDGTIHEVMNGVREAPNVLVGAICAGSGNDFSRSFPTFKSSHEIDKYVQESNFEYKTNDCGCFVWNEEKIRFINNAGIGFDAFVAYTANLSRFKKHLNTLGLGKLSYAYSVLKSVFTFKMFDVIVEQGGQQRKYDNVWFVTVSNQPYFGGGMKISPSSIPDDGLLELSIVYNLSRLKLLLMFVTVFFGAHIKLKEFVQVQDEQFTLYINDEVPCHTDGEILGLTKKNSKISCMVQKKCWKAVTKNSNTM
ncbi:diacylglycerol/lipid kinase family protein [Ureibacillus aquaedulcis]|uniref:Diacylglycerol kinase family lipid kinase n=1 Tax=Ureibacillus aquaedulcis TaxID=3058421 RepID=A0ABT8GQM4_9BACL|nr:diacylglycerol kinase family protein [Ureibacillus sp. BA0131]MDN4493722.1 diacylglycerol kinase family lipid kinase [Ureibacillus sp. BA0131]